MQHQVFCADPCGEQTVAADPHAFRLAQAQRLRSQRVGAFRGAHTEGQRTETAIGTGMAVAADDGEPRQNDAKLRPHDVDDAVSRLAKVEHPHAGARRTFAQRSQQLATQRERVAVAAWQGGHGVVGAGKHQACIVQRQPAPCHLPQSRRTGQVVQDVPVDMQQRPAVAEIAHHVRVP